jgi:4-aminobutyrate aminotransferase-like enzyme
VLGKAPVMDAPGEGAVGGTYVGNPVAQAAALAVLDVIETEGLIDRAAAIGETIRGRMEAWQERWPQIADVRGLGSMLAIELPDAQVASRVVEAAFQRGLLLLKAGVRLDCIRVLLPLVISDGELDEALGVWEDALSASL